MSVPTAQDETERILGGRYRLEVPIGQGGTATVYRARDESLGRTVAVKLFHAGSVDPGRQETELSVLAGLDHHALVSLFDAGIDQDESGRARRFLVMALVKGMDMRARLAGPPIAARHIAEVGYDMAEALDYIHAHSVIHRDIKPSNLLLVDYGATSSRARAKLTDFGIALSEDVERMTAEGTTTGTAAYLSPEQASGAKVGAATDVYSLGLVLLECFTRRVEFPGSVVESAVARLSRDPAVPKHLPDHWRQLLLAMTARDPADRPTRGELVATLKQVVIAESGRHKDVEGDAFSPNAADPYLGTPQGILDTLPDEALHRVTAMAARLFSAPISIVSVVDHDRTWFKSYYGAEVEKVARAVDLSKTAIPQEEPVVVEDASTDPRTESSSLVTGPLGLRFYVGVPLKRHDGRTIGTLSVLDFKPGSASESEVANLQDLAALVVAQQELRQQGIRTGEVSSSVTQTL
ncbi:MAG: eukaryotic-like serine/threonine-protein kinase [Microbacteriaceae bacterium]|nr:eukaryotic-like serine/threonine-protein kinase [Microbacteriaceae bacterium]